MFGEYKNWEFLNRDQFLPELSDLNIVKKRFTYPLQADGLITAGWAPNLQPVCREQKSLNLEFKKNL